MGGERPFEWLLNVAMTRAIFTIFAQRLILQVRQKQRQKVRCLGFVLETELFKISRLWLSR